MGSIASLTRPADFRAVMADGERSGGRGMTVYVRRSQDNGPRLGLVVKASGSVSRNRVKRRLRAAVQAAGPAVGTDVVIRADDRAAGRDFQEMVTIVRGALGEGGGR